ncbi:unnamed protein product, partial [Brachionus calyciflorus]
MSVQEQEKNDREKLNLDEFVTKNQLPCFCEVNIADADIDNVEYDQEELYLYRQFEIDCIFAKCYSNILETFLLHHRPSYVPSESELNLTINNQTSDMKYLFSDIISIPYNYHGLFEIFSSNSTKSDGILDHEKDIVSLMTRIRKPKLYYVSKDMKVYEMTPFKNIDDSINMSRKWINVSKGSIVKICRVVSIDYEDTTSSFLKQFNKIFCCKRRKTKTEVAIELKIVEDFDEILHESNYDSESDNLKKKFDSRHTHARLSRANIQTKAYFLPVYEKTGLNEEIDLIPISSIVKNQKLKLNSLQLSKNFASDNLTNDLIEVKLYEENPFKPTKNSFQNNPKEITELLQDNQHLEFEKYISIYHLIQYRPNCKIIVGFSFTKQALVFLPAKPINIGLNKKCFYSKINEKNRQNSEYFNLKLKEIFVETAEIEISRFAHNLNKIETFAFKKKNFEGLEMNEIEKFLAKPTHKKEHLIKHFSDFAYSDKTTFKFDDSLKRSESSSSAIQLKTDKQKYKTLPFNHSSQSSTYKENSEETDLNIQENLERNDHLENLQYNQ